MTTVEEIVKSMEEKNGQAERVWVMDCGMVSEQWMSGKGLDLELPTRNRILGVVSPSAATQM